MVIGIVTFKEAFKGYEDCYTIIGGTACDILMNKENLDFRATKDIDMILLIENSDEVSSLSAIMLNDDYYGFMMSGRTIVDGVGILGAEHLIPFKMRAWLDLCRRKSGGEHVNTADIKKHKNDVFRLMNVINPDEIIPAPEAVKEDVRQFIARMPEERINMKNIGLDMELDAALQILKNMYIIM